MSFPIVTAVIWPTRPTGFDARVQSIRGRVVCALVGVVGAVMAFAAPAAAQTPEALKATFVARYANNVPANVRGAVDFALSLWSQRLASAIPIEVDVDWGGGLPSNVAAATEPVAYERVADGSQQPVALANAVAGRDLEPGLADVHLLLGGGIRWYTGVDGNCPANATDMVTMVLHELAHGLAFAESFHSAGGGLAWGHDGAPVGLDAGLFDPSTGPLVAAPSAQDALSAATSRRIVWRGSARDSHGRAPVFYAPRQFEPGSSLSHLDDDAYPQGDPDALMTSLIRRGEVIRRIGPAALGIMRDLGWQVYDEPARPAAAPRPATPVSVAPPVVAVTQAPPNVASVVGASPVVKKTAIIGDFGHADGAPVGAFVPTLVFALGVLRRRARTNEGWLRGRRARRVVAVAGDVEAA